MLKQCIELIKPERTLANVITGLAGFLLASKWHMHATLLVATLGGMSLIVASACALNNYIDRNLDARMPRTKKRVLASKQLAPSLVLGYAVMLGIAGFVVLGLFVNALVTVLGAIAYVDYIVLYGYSKRRSAHSTLIGTISGAMPIAAGYCAVTDRIDAAAIILFMSMVCWQMPHFYAIAIFRMKDYRAGNIPVLPLVKGVHRTKVQMLIYTALFILAALSLSIFGHTGYIYAVVIALLGADWLWRGMHGFHTENDTIWARKMFFFSLKALLVFCLMVAVGGLLP